MVIALLSILISMAIVVLMYKYWRIFKWILLPSLGIAAWLVGAFLVLLLLKSMSPHLNNGLAAIGSLMWPLLAWAIWESAKDKE